MKDSFAYTTAIDMWLRILVALARKLADDIVYEAHELTKFALGVRPFNYASRLEETISRSERRRNEISITMCSTRLCKPQEPQICCATKAIMTKDSLME